MAARDIEADLAAARALDFAVVCAAPGCAPRPALPTGTCASCRVTSYCSRECQLAHWRAGHKAACPTWAAAVRAAAAASSSPVPSVSDAIRQLVHNDEHPDVADVPRIVRLCGTLALSDDGTLVQHDIARVSVVALARIEDISIDVKTLAATRDALVLGGAVPLLVRIVRAAVTLGGGDGHGIARYAVVVLNNLAVRGSAALVARGLQPRDPNADWRCNQLIAAGAIDALVAVVTAFPAERPSASHLLRLLIQLDGGLFAVSTPRAALAAATGLLS